jgi:hypothetical protein
MAEFEHVLKTTFVHTVVYRQKSFMDFRACKVFILSLKEGYTLSTFIG